MKKFIAIILISLISLKESFANVNDDTQYISEVIDKINSFNGLNKSEKISAIYQIIKAVVNVSTVSEVITGYKAITEEEQNIIITMLSIIFLNYMEVFKESKTEKSGTIEVNGKKINIIISRSPGLDICFEIKNKKIINMYVTQNSIFKIIEKAINDVISQNETQKNRSNVYSIIDEFNKENCKNIS